MPSQDPVKPIYDGRKMEHAEHTADRSSEANLGQEKDAPTLVTLYRSAVAEYKPPTFHSPFLRHRGQ